MTSGMRLASKSRGILAGRGQNCPLVDELRQFVTPLVSTKDVRSHDLNLNGDFATFSHTAVAVDL